MKLNLYSVNDKYIKYLRQFDDKIYDNKEGNRNHERKYVGIVLTINDFNYYIPMSSPKKSDLPVPITELEPYILSNEKDLKYREVIMGELKYINNNSNKIVKYAKVVYNQKIKDIDVGYIKNTVDFKLLEKKLVDWDKYNN